MFLISELLFCLELGWTLDPRGVGNLSGGCRCLEPLTGQSDLRRQETVARNCCAPWRRHPGRKEPSRVRAGSSMQKRADVLAEDGHGEALQPRVTEVGVMFQVLFAVL